MQINLFRHKVFTMAALLTGCFFVYSCRGNTDDEIKAVTESKELLEEARNIEALLSQEGVVKAKLKSPLMLRHTKDSLFAEFPKTLHVDFFDSTAKIQSWLDAKYGKYFESQNKVYLRDSVITINVNGDTLKTDELWWDQQKEKFYTDKAYQLNTKTRRIHGPDGLEASQDFKEISFNNPAGVIQVSQSGFPE